MTNRRPAATADRVEVMIGRGWEVPAAIVFVYIASIYMPTHPVGPGAPGLMAAAGALYVVGLSVILPRLLRGLVLRAAGSSEPIVLLGRVPNVLDRAGLHPRWRLAAVGVGVMASSVAAVGAARLVSSAAPGTYPHAIGGLVLATNVALALGSLAPLPGLGGWSGLLALADLRRVAADRRVGWTATAARRVALLVGGGASLLGLAVGDPTIIAFGFFLAIIMWLQARAALNLDTAERFFARHTAADLAHPLTAVRRSDERLVDLLPAACTSAALVVDPGGAMLGALGPRQIRRALRTAPPAERCAEAMIPTASLTIVPGTAPAEALLAPLAANGLALVRGEAGFLVADADDVGRELRIWVLLEELGRRRPVPSAASPGSGPDPLP